MRKLLTVWQFEYGIQFMVNAGYLYLSWRWPFITVCRAPKFHPFAVSLPPWTPDGRLNAPMPRRYESMRDELPR